MPRVSKFTLIFDCQQDVTLQDWSNDRSQWERYAVDYDPHWETVMTPVCNLPKNNQNIKMKNFVPKIGKGKAQEVTAYFK